MTEKEREELKLHYRDVAILYPTFDDLLKYEDKQGIDPRTLPSWEPNVLRWFEEYPELHAHRKKRRAR